MQFQEANGHHGQVRHHVILFQERPHGTKHFRRVRVLPCHYAIEGQFRFVSPVPRIIEGFDLCPRFFTSSAPKKNVVVRLTVERGIKVNEVHTLIVCRAAQDRQVVAVIEPVHETASVPEFRTANQPGRLLFYPFPSFLSRAAVDRRLYSLKFFGVCSTLLMLKELLWWRVGALNPRPKKPAMKRT